jgi:hypothetical protein
MPTQEPCSTPLQSAHALSEPHSKKRRYKLTAFLERVKIQCQGGKK